jgi:nicotinamide phosphoribosyltransferase
MTLENLAKVVERTNSGIGVPVQSCLIDTFDDERYIKKFVIPNAKKIEESGGKYVCRPDSGNAVTKPIEVCEWLLDGLFPVWSPHNEAGFQTLPAHFGVIQGDGLKLWDFIKIFQLAEKNRLASSNFVFGFGGGMTNGSGRDDFSFSMKATARQSDSGAWESMMKAPKTDPGKNSLRGRVGVISRDGEFVVSEYGEGNQEMVSLYFNGDLLYSRTFDKVREVARM